MSLEQSRKLNSSNDTGGIALTNGFDGLADQLEGEYEVENSADIDVTVVGAIDDVNNDDMTANDVNNDDMTTNCVDNNDVTTNDEVNNTDVTDNNGGILKITSENTLNSAPDLPLPTVDVSTEIPLPDDELTMVNMACLQPAKLQILSLKVNELDVTSLVDSGATKNLVRHNIVKSSGTLIEPCQPILIKGLGESLISSVGSAILPLNFFGVNMSLPVIIVPDSSINFDLVLGLQFLQDEGISVDLAKRKLSKVYSDESKIYFYLHDDGALNEMIFENIPVFAENDIIVSRNGDKVPITTYIDFDHFEQLDNFYYEGKIKPDTYGVDGILSFSDSNSHIIMCASVRDKKSIRKGDRVGKVSSIIQLEADVDDDNSKRWTLEQLQNDIELDDSLDQDQKNRIFDMLLLTQKVMSKGDNDIGKARVAPHVIELTDYTPIWQRPRRFSDPVNKEIDRQCSELLSMDVLEYSDSPFSAAVVPVRKRTGELRMCIDYRMLNKVTKSENFPMPNVAEAIYKPHNINFFTKLDLVRGYYQVPLEKNSRKFTAFSTPHNSFQFKCLSFGLKNAGISFQRNMQQILSEFCFQNVLVYIDDILIMTESFDEHMTLVGKVLTTLSNNGIKIKVKKCQFFAKQVDFLGHQISREGIKKSQEFIRKVSDYALPQTVTQLRQFLGLVNFQRKFIDQCSTIAKPLTELTGGPKKKILTWTPEMKTAFDSLKEALVRDVTLSFPDYTENAEKLELFVDASAIGTGACLVQRQSGQYRTIAYSSMTFSPTQRRYSTIERELVALRWGIKTFRSFLFAVPFILYTDHKPLLYLNNMAKENSRLMRTLNELAEYDFIIRYRPGRDNEAADTMSRIMNVPESDDYECLDLLPTGLVVYKTVDGGGDSFFVSLQICLNDIADDLNVTVPDNCDELRSKLVDCLAGNLRKFNIKPSKEFTKRLKVMRRPGQLPCDELIPVVCVVYQVEIHVHHGSQWPIIYRPSDTGEFPVINLQCKAGVHFNPVFDKRRTVSQINLDSKYVNCVEYKYLEDSEHIKSEPVCRSLPNSCSVSCFCVHGDTLPASCNVSAYGINFCALVDTGAQVSLLSQGTFERLKERCRNLVLTALPSKVLKGIDGCFTDTLGYVELIISIQDTVCQCPIPFVVVKDAEIPYCALLGSNFLIANNIVVDFRTFLMQIKSSCSDNFSTVCLNRGIISREPGESNQVSLLSIGTLTLTDLSSESDADSVTDVELDHRVSFLSRVQLINLQSADQSLASLKQKLVDNIPCKHWREPYLRQYKRDSKHCRVVNDLLILDRGENTVPLISFDFLVRFVIKTHSRLAHIGKHKLEHLLRRQMFHPSLNKVIADLCQCCEHCQLFKVASQPKSPPTLKIRSRYPFDLVAMDLLQFPKSSSGNVVALVVVDHNSKFVIAVPLKDKKSASVCKALNSQVFPHMIRLPTRVITDNGAEYRSNLFEETLNALNITHVFSTRYRAQGNGAVERVNRTITEFLRGIVSENPNQWDVALGKAVIVYNTTWHSMINDTPTNFLLSRSHNVDDSLPFEADTTNTWTEAHPDFASFSVGAKVVLKVNKIGNSLSYKLGQKYTGPYSVVKVQSNDVTYEISNETKVIKAHHRQLKLWHDPPDYMTDYLCEHDIHAGDAISNVSSSSEDIFCIAGNSQSNSVTSTESDAGIEDISDEFISEIVSDNKAISWITSELKDKFNNLTTRFVWYKGYLSETAIHESLDVALDESIINWSFDSGDFEFTDVPKVSSPMFEMDRATIELEDEVSPVIHNDMRAKPVQSASVDDSFLLWLEQSLHVQEDCVQKIVDISNQLNDAWLEDISDVLALSSCTDDLSQTNRINVLQEMNSHIKKVYSSVAAYRSDRSNTEYKNRIDSVENVGANVDTLSESSDIVPDMNIASSSVFKRMTRSQGNVPEYPHVMKRPVEFK